MPTKIAELLHTAPDWATADPRSSEVAAWIERARQIARELRPIEAGALRVYLQFVDKDPARHGPEIVDILRRVAGMRTERGT